MRNRPLCIAPKCSSRGYHSDDCDDDTCAGCQPRLAADGLNLCQPDRDRLGDHATRAAKLHTELALQLVAAGGPGEKTSGTPTRGATLNDRAAEARTTVRAVLASWCRLISEERGIRLPSRLRVEELPLGFIGPPAIRPHVDDTPNAMGAYLSKHADWLAAHPAAGECSDELADLIRMAHPIAYPTGARVFEVGPCVELDCAGTVKAILRRVDALLPSSIVCDTDPAHAWPADQWLTLGRKLRTKEAA